MPYIGGASGRINGILWSSARHQPARIERPHPAVEAHERPETRLSALAAEGARRAGVDPLVEGPGRESDSAPLVPNRTANGSAQSGAFTSAKAAIASMLGVVTYPAPATLRVNGRTVTIDLAVESLSSIAARVLTEARTSATVEEDSGEGSARYRLVVEGEVEPAGPADEQVAAMVGFLRERGSPPAAPPGPGPEGGRQSAMLERFHAIDAAMSRIREQPTLLLAGLRELPTGALAG